MKITSVDVFECPGTRYAWVFLRLHTDEGIYGVGQASSGPGSSMVAAAARKLDQWLIGEDPTRIEHLNIKLYKLFSSIGSRGFISALISGVDIALWDIRGKQLGLPIYELLGGRFRDDLLLYSNGWSHGCDTPEDYAAAAKKTVDVGHTAIKLDPYKLDDSPRQHGGGLSMSASARGTAIIQAIRESVGPDVEILIDTHGKFDVPTAVRLAKAVEPSVIGWFEEPVPPENVDALRQVKDQISIPLCVGERLIGRYEFRPILEQGLCNYLMPDVVRTGGISELKKIAIMAEPYFVPISPHDATGPITLIAGAQTVMSVPNFYRLEIAYSELPQYNKALDPPLDVRNGIFYVSDRPGLGHDLNPDYLAEAL